MKGRVIAEFAEQGLGKGSFTWRGHPSLRAAPSQLSELR